MSDIPVKPAAAPRRDALGQLCHALHLVVMLFIVFGWAIPYVPLLVFYLAFLPAVVVQWRFNRSSCVLNNVESLIRTGNWRDPGNAEEGAWLAGLARNVLGLNFKPTQLDAFVYVMMGLLWAVALAHFLRG